MHQNPKEVHERIFTSTLTCKHLATLDRGQGGLFECTRAKGQPQHRKGKILSRRRARRRQRPLRRDLRLRNWYGPRCKSDRTEQLLSRIFFKCCDSGAVTRDLEHINQLSALSHTPGDLGPLKHHLNLLIMIHLQLQQLDREKEWGADLEKKKNTPIFRYY